MSIRVEAISGAMFVVERGDDGYPLRAVPMQPEDGWMAGHHDSPEVVEWGEALLDEAGDQAYGVASTIRDWERLHGPDRS